MIHVCGALHADCRPIERILPTSSSYVCGIVGVITALSAQCAWTHADVARARDMMEHRGPDGAGLWPERAARDSHGITPHAILGHRRLSIVDHSQAGAQPFVVSQRNSDPRGVLVYNGELYNASELRGRIAAHTAWQGCKLHEMPRSDTWALAQLLALEGEAATRHLRGMFAFAWLDLQREQFVLARDPLGIKPLLYTVVHPSTNQASNAHLLFASELPALLSLREKHAATRPDLACVSAYLSTIRTTLGNRTMMEGVYTVLPAQSLVWSLAGSRALQIGTSRTIWTAPPRTPQTTGSVATTRDIVAASISCHAIADVPLCSMLSGGLDSTIITAQLAQQQSQRSNITPQLHTYCARATHTDNQPTLQDADFAQALARTLGTCHHEAALDSDGFLVRWAAMVDALGTPLSTPNETAIFEVLRIAREQGQRVALSGEGADELFGGYTLVLGAVERAIAGRSLSASEHATIALESGAWIGKSLKPQVLTEHAWQAVDQDSQLHDWAAAEFASLLALDDDHSQPVGAGGSVGSVGTHLRWQRRVNLAGLLQRFDTASMLASVEGRTPFADVVVAEWAESLPMHALFDGVNGKLPLRRAFSHLVPPEIAQRAKASFPLPFQTWMQPLASLIEQSPLLRSLVRAPVLALAAQHSQEHWNLAWPMANVALWEQRWWPAQTAQTVQATNGKLRTTC